MLRTELPPDPPVVGTLVVPVLPVGVTTFSALVLPPAPTPRELRSDRVPDTVGNSVERADWTVAMVVR